MNRLTRRCLLSSAALGLVSRAQGAAPAPIGAAQIGTRHSHATGKLEAMLRDGSGFHVLAVCEPDAPARAAAQRHQAYAGLAWRTVNEILADPAIRLVTVETSLADATSTARRAVEAGKHVHLDKPGGTNVEAFAAMRRQAEERGLIVQMGYMLRANPAFTLLFRAARAGWLGEITEIHASMGKLADAGLRRELLALPGHGMFELACHLVDAVVTLLGEPQAVTAFAVATRSPADALPDHQLAVLEYPRALVTLRCHHADPHGGPRRLFSVAGTKGSVEIQPLESGRVTLRLAEASGGFPKGESTHALPLPRGRYDGEFDVLAGGIQGGAAYPWTAAHDIAVLRTALRASGIRPDP